MCNLNSLLRSFLVPRTMMTASWPSKAFFTSSLFRTSPTTTLAALWSAGSLAGSRTSTVTLYPEETWNKTNLEIDLPTHYSTVILTLRSKGKLNELCRQQCSKTKVQATWISYYLNQQFQKKTWKKMWGMLVTPWQFTLSITIILWLSAAPGWSKACGMNLEPPKK